MNSFGDLGCRHPIRYFDPIHMGHLGIAEATDNKLVASITEDVANEHRFHSGKSFLMRILHEEGHSHATKLRK